MLILKLGVFLICFSLFAQDQNLLSLNIPQNTSSVIKLFFLITLLSFGPAILMSMTTFTRIVIVLGLIRTSLGLQGFPPNLVLIGISLFITSAIMGSVFEASYMGGIQPYLSGGMDEMTAFGKAVEPLRQFIMANTRKSDIEFFVALSKLEINSGEEIPLYILVPAFVVSELTVAFAIGFFVALPFLVIDIVVASILASMSMITLPPISISLPLKLMLFVAVDGWRLVIEALAKGYVV